MAKTKILIIEDNPEEYENIVAVLSAYDIEYFPQKNESDEFLLLLRQYASRGKDNDFNEIKKMIIEFSPDYVLLDVVLSMKNGNDKTGIKLKKEIIDKDLNSVITFFLTASSVVGLDQNPEDEYIQKASDGISLHEKIKEKFDKYKIPHNPAISYKANGTNLNKWAKKWDDYIQKPIQVILDQIIRLTFYALIGLFSMGSVILLICDAYRDRHDPIKIAEHAFVSFLPLLITFGFFVFYERSLKQFVLRESIILVNYEEASQLMNLTKKLFVSSLISYLFIKLIVLVTESSDTSNSIQKIKESQTMLGYLYLVNPLYQLALIGSCILGLLFYFFLLNRKH